MKKLLLFVSAVFFSFASFALTPITGTLAVCAGGTAYLADTTGGGTWSSSNIMVATVGSTGIAAGLSAGTATITYTLGGSYVTATFVVHPVPAAITGTATVCELGSTTLSDATAGGVWSSDDAAIASVGAGTGVVSGVAGGATDILYTLPGGCAVSFMITITPWVDSISAASYMCTGSTITLTDATTGGSWNTGDASIATVGSATGVVTGISAGTVSISYTTTTGPCGGGLATRLVTVISSSSAGAISGPSTLSAGTYSSLYDAMPSGSWSSSNPAVATVDGMGDVGGIAAGTATITYTSGCSSLVYTTFVITVSPAYYGFGPITGTLGTCVGATSPLTDSTTGGVWSSSDPLVATIGVTGIVTGIAPGTAIITYIFDTSETDVVFTVSAAPAAIGGATTVCGGSTATLTDATPGGAWSSDETWIATIGASSGIATGVSAGAATIVYTLGVGCSVSRVITVSTSGAGYIMGSSTVAAGSVDYLADSVTGGAWSSGDAAIATVGSLTGIATGISAGTVTVTYTVAGCSGYVSATFVLTVSPYVLDSIGGPSGVCSGTTATLTDASVGGTWTSSNAAIASVNPATGVVTGVSAGTVIITYRVGALYTIAPFVVIAPLPAITGPSTVCTGGYITLSDATAGGVWSTTSSDASVGYYTGEVYGVSAGTATISYSVYGCSVSATVSVSTLSAGSITGDTSVCSGHTITLTDAVSGGVWSSSNTSVATVSGGIVTGISAGYSVISYTVTGSCGSVSAILYVYVDLTDPGSITGTSGGTIGSATTLSDWVAGGSWSSSNPSIASVDAATGVVTAVSIGVVTITYTVSGCSGPAYTTISFSVYGIIAGNINFTGASYSGPVMVWLITYNPLTYDLQAIDSTVVYSYGAGASYQFLNEPTDSFRIKGAIDSIFSGPGYIPTYHTSSYYWHDANVLYHLSTGADYGQDINMDYGAVTAGPGFIGGNVMTGANRGASTGIPAIGLLMVAVNSAGAEVQHTYTDAGGNYSFSALPLDTYKIHPEAINYLSTDYTSITLTSGTSSVSATDFIQHTISHTITPVTNQVQVLKSTVSSVITFPNPTTGGLNIQWLETATENGSVTLSDITGREIYKGNINMTEGTGVSKLDLSQFSNGLYIISVKSGNINYNNKIQIQH
jgi:uncharacterized protein YjdB